MYTVTVILDYIDVLIFAATKPDSHLQGVPICGFSGGNQGQWLVVRDKMILGRVSKNHFNQVDVTTFSLHFPGESAAEQSEEQLRA